VVERVDWDADVDAWWEVVIVDEEAAGEDFTEAQKAGLGESKRFVNASAEVEAVFEKLAVADLFGGGEYCTGFSSESCQRLRVVREMGEELGN